MACSVSIADSAASAGDDCDIAQFLGQTAFLLDDGWVNLGELVTELALHGVHEVFVIGCPLVLLILRVFFVVRLPVILPSRHVRDETEPVVVERYPDADTCATARSTNGPHRVDAAVKVAPEVHWQFENATVAWSEVKVGGGLLSV